MVSYGITEGTRSGRPRRVSQEINIAEQGRYVVCHVLNSIAWSWIVPESSVGTRRVRTLECLTCDIAIYCDVQIMLLVCGIELEVDKQRNELQILWVYRGKSARG